MNSIAEFANSWAVLILVLCAACVSSKPVKHKAPTRVMSWCEMASHPEQYDGRNVLVSAHFVVTLHGNYYIYGSNCPNLYVGMNFVHGKKPGFDDEVIKKSVEDRSRGGRADFPVIIQGIFSSKGGKGIPALHILTLHFVDSSNK